MPTIVNTFHEKGRFVINPLDVYLTPYELAKAAATIMFADVAWSLPGPRSILDPGCGDKGVWGRAFHTLYPSTDIAGVELRYLENDDCYAETWFGADFLTWQPERKFDMVIGNPPYSSKTNKILAEQFVRKSLDHLEDGGYLMFLLKNDFSGGTKRFNNLFREYKPLRIYKSARRVPLLKSTHKNRTNTTEYSLFVWEKGKTNQHDTIFRWFEWDKKGLVTLL